MTADGVAAVTIVEELHAEGQPVVTRPALYRRVKDETDSESIDHAAVKAALADEGWEYGRHLYFHADGLADRIAEIATAYRDEGRLLVTHRQLCDRLAGEARGGVEGWQKGPFVEQVTAAATAAGWLTDTFDGAGTRVYVYPLLDAIRDEHPSGRFWRSPEELFGYYLSQSATDAATDE